MAVAVLAAAKGASLGKGGMAGSEEASVGSEEASVASAAGAAPMERRSKHLWGWRQWTP